MSIAENLASVRKRIDEAVKRAGRNPDEVTLMAVSKTFPADAVVEAYAAGQRVFGENRVQEFAQKCADVRTLEDLSFHLIGHLQSNKSAKAAELFDAVDSVDSLRLAERLNESAAKLGKILPVLIEINVGGEQQKAGLAPDSPELEGILQAAPRLEHLRIRGLMTVPPLAEDPEEARPFFKSLRELRGALAQRRFPAVSFDVLSMGMSHDFEVAIEEGSTMVRIGTSIFGHREKMQ